MIGHANGEMRRAITAIKTTDAGLALLICLNTGFGPALSASFHSRANACCPALAQLAYQQSRTPLCIYSGGRTEFMGPQLCLGYLG